MAEFLKLDQYPADVLWILTFLIIGGGTVVGYITDAVMGTGALVRLATASLLLWAHSSASMSVMPISA